jgi:hypothetical protein
MSQGHAIEHAPVGPEAPHDDGGETHPHASGTVAVRIFALGQALVEKDGRPLDSPDWIQKPRELLY